jgi:hypothetical protein
VKASRVLLRRAVLGFGGALILGGLMLMASGCPPGVGMRLAVPGLVLIAAVIGERWRYTRLETGRPGSGWVATDERFLDPESGKLVTVFYRPATGERRYVS